MHSSACILQPEVERQSAKHIEASASSGDENVLCTFQFAKEWDFHALSLCCSAWEVVNGNWNSGSKEFLFHDFSHDLPPATCESATDARHVDGCTEPSRFKSHTLEALANRLVAHRWDSVDSSDVSLADQIGDPETVADLNELDLSQRERLFLFAAMPRSVALLGFRPTFGNGRDESASPASNVVAHVDNDLRPFADRLDCVSDDVIDAHAISFFSSLRQHAFPLCDADDSFRAGIEFQNATWPWPI